MSQNPVGTITDEERLVPLVTRGDAFLVDVTDPVQTADIPEEGSFVWHLREEGDVNRLAFAPIDDPDDAGDLSTWELSSTDDGLTIDVPEELLVDGLDLDVEMYDGDNPLLFKPNELSEGVAVGMTLEGEPGGTADVAIELVPVRYADGTPYSNEPVRESSMDSDPVAEAELDHDQGGTDGTPRTDAISAPVDIAIVDEVLETTDVPRSEVVQALETISRNDVVGQADDDSEFDPVAVGNRIVVALNDDSWTQKIDPALDAADEVGETVRKIYARQADILLQDSEGDRNRFEEYHAVVV